ncbi:hypothetical protein RHSIM_Rhsim04G0121100 [Rhododendron simsii]|uniref:Uncharacterized protein n=1 Tax=Rhododendron simsii TaxID=118357 RepID=A0A834H0U0_RHOSS|nr:hypothetical protein RHSIM_Rhsim04G0121100 [Rhododendron simsii]
MSDHEHEMDDMDGDTMDEGAEFDIPQNAELNDELMPEINNDADACKRALARMIIIDESPFSFVEGQGFKDFISVVQPMWNPSRRLAMAKQIMVICSAHILNLIVREELQEIDVLIARVRNMVRYVRSSPSRMAEFWSCVEKEKIMCWLKPCLDVSTWWNYTYFMLERALTYQKAFDRLCDDPSFKLNVKEEEMDEDLMMLIILKHNGSVNVRNKEVGGSSDTVDLDGLETDFVCNETNVVKGDCITMLATLHGTSGGG